MMAAATAAARQGPYPVAWLVALQERWIRRLLDAQK
jgi:hypothetical protein